MLVKIEIKIKVVIFHSRHRIITNLQNAALLSKAIIWCNRCSYCLSVRFFTSWDREVSVFLCLDLTSVAELKLRLDNRLTAVSTQLFISYDFLFICFAWCSFIKIALIVCKKRKYENNEKLNFGPKTNAVHDLYWVKWQKLPLLVGDVHDTHSNHTYASSSPILKYTHALTHTHTHTIAHAIPNRLHTRNLLGIDPIQLFFSVS